MAKKKAVIFLVCFLVLAVNRAGWSDNRDPMAYYQEAQSLDQEAANAMLGRDFESAMIKSKYGLKKLEFIRQEFPKWEYIPSQVALLEAKFNRRINIIESRSHVGRGYDYKREGRYEEALKEFNAVLDKYKDKPLSCAIAQRAIGDIYFEQSKYEEALKAYTIVLEKYEGQSRIISALAQACIGKIYILMGKYEDALKAHNTVLNKYKDQREACVIAQHEIGYIYLRMGKYEEAKGAWNKVVNEYNGHPYAKITKYILENIPLESVQNLIDEDKNIFTSAIKLFLGQISNEEFLSLSIKSGENFENDALYFIAAKFQMDGKTDEAVKYYQKCIDSSKDKDLVYNLALKALKKIKK